MASWEKTNRASCWDSQLFAHAFAKTTAKQTFGGHSFTASQEFLWPAWYQRILLPAQNTKHIFMNLLMQMNTFINEDLASVHLQFTHIVDYSDSTAATPLCLEHQNLLCCFYASLNHIPSLPLDSHTAPLTYFTSFLLNTSRSALGHRCAETHCYPKVINNPVYKGLTFCSVF